MGLSSSAQSFQRLLDHVLEGVDNIFIYLDDIMVFNKNETDHMKTLGLVFKRRLTMNTQKLCSWHRQVNRNIVR